jgi:predicted amidohydrolase YtcJ
MPAPGFRRGLLICHERYTWSMVEVRGIINAKRWDPARGICKEAPLHMRDGLFTDAVDAPTAVGEEVIDAAGAVVLPGFIDAHVHLLLGGASLRQCDLSHVTTREEFIHRIDAAHHALPTGQWLIATGWSEDRLADRSVPDRTWLRGAGERPVVCYRTDLHAVLVNDPVLAQLDLSHVPEGGRIVRDAQTSEPTGVLYEAAAWELVNPLIPDPAAPQKREDLLAAQAHCHALGITAVGSMEYARDVRDVFQPMRDALALRCALTLLDRDWPLDLALAETIEPDDVLRIIGFKAFIDGTLGSRTARMYDAYADDPGNRGLFVELALRGQLAEWAQQVAGVGLSPSMHAIGDEAVGLALDVIESLPAAIRPRLEHAQQVRPDDFNRFHDVIASMQPIHRTDDARIAQQRLGSDRLAGFFPFRSLGDAGARLAFGSDWPVMTCDPIAGIRAAVTGVIADGTIFQPRQCVDVATAIRASTAGAAYALRMPHIGRLESGAAADLVMLDRDPITADWLNEPPRVIMTIANGKVVFDGR